MPRSAKTVLVAPIQGEVLRYTVESWSEPDKPHLCDLSMNRGNGACSCRDFVTRRGPAIKAGKPLFTQATTCRHLRMARKYFTIATLQEMASRIHPHGEPAE
jgi:hypothetical protein